MPSQFTLLAPRAMRALMQAFSITKFDAAAMLGNFGHESAGFTKLQEISPTVAGSAGGYGWAQWTGPRRRAFMTWCKKNSLKPASYGANIGYVLVELRGDYRHAVNAVLAHGALEDKVEAFERHYEQAGVKHYKSRLEWAQRALAAFDGAPDTVNSKPLKKSRTIKGAGAGAGGVIAAGGGALEAVKAGKERIEAAGDTAASTGAWFGLSGGEALLAGGLALALGCFLYVAWCRWDDAGRSLPCGRK